MNTHAALKLDWCTIGQSCGRWSLLGNKIGERMLKMTQGKPGTISEGEKSTALSAAAAGGQITALNHGMYSETTIWIWGVSWPFI